MTLDQFNAQLNAFESNLVGLYKQKNQLIGSREAFRFQYVTALKAEWQALTQAVMAVAYASPNSNGANLIAAVLSLIQSSIVMTDMNGTPLTGWYQWNPGDLGNGGGVPNAGFLSPVDNLITLPFWGPTNTNQNPAYKISDYGINSVGSAGQIVDSAVLAPSVVNTVDRASGNVIPFAIPPTIDWCNGYFYGQNNILPYLADSLTFMQSALTGSYSVGTVQSVLNDFKNLLLQLVSGTQSIISIALTIDAAETALAQFVASYTDFGSTLNVAQILSDLKNQANMPDPPAIIPAVAATVPQVAAVPVAVAVAAPTTVTAPTSSSTPWLIGAAVLGAVLLGGSKK